ncbi:MAG: ESX secretion-associated protein EspG [Pseudonocardiaceae bacterium]
MARLSARPVRAALQGLGSLRLGLLVSRGRSVRWAGGGAARTRSGGARPIWWSPTPPGLDERDQLDDQAWRQLRARGLVDVRRPRPEVEDALGTLAHPAVEADLRMMTGPGQEVRVLACASGMVGLVSVVTEQAVDLVPAHPSRLAEGLLAHVPDHPAATGNAVSIPAGICHGAGLRADTELARLERVGLRTDDARQVRRLIAGSVVRWFTIGAAARDRAGRRHRARDVVSVLDTEHGRIQIRHDAATPDGTRLLLAPTDRRRLSSEVTALLRTAVDAAALEP